VRVRARAHNYIIFQQIMDTESTHYINTYRFYKFSF